MTDGPNKEASDAPLNPALKSVKDTTYDTTSTTPAPIDTASAQEGEGESWPVVWLIVTIVCVAIVIFLLL